MNTEAEAHAPASTPSEATTRLKEEIEQTRGDLSETVAALEEKLAPSQVREAVSAELQLVENRVREVLDDQIAQAKTFVQDEVRDAKNALSEGLHETERLIRTGLSDARETVREDLKNAITGARESVRAATVGRVETFATTVGDTMNDARDTLLDTLYNNPLPAALTGVGLAWLLMNRSKSASNRFGNGPGGGVGYSTQHGLRQMGEQLGSAVGTVGAAVGRAAHQATGAVAEGLHGATDAAESALGNASGIVTSLAQTAGEGAQQAAHTVQEGATAIASTAQQSARRVEQAFQRQLRERPLAVGAAALAIGTMVGCSLPHTETEDSLMGEARDNVLFQAGDAVHEAAAAVSNLSQKMSNGDESNGDANPQGDTQSGKPPKAQGAASGMGKS